MKGKKNLERAIVLGLLLSTSVYGSAWADPAINDDTVDSQPQYKDSVTIEGDANTSAIEITKDNEVPVTIKGEESITLESGKYGIRLEANRDITLNAGGDNVIKVTANSTDDEIGDGINVTENAGGTITLNGANNTIAVEGEHSDGIYTAAGSATNIGLVAAAGSNTITATNNGIDHRGNNTITLEANGGSNIIQATNGDGIRVEGTGTVEFNAQNNEITAGDNGIQVEGGGSVNITANSGSNTITAITNGIYASGANSAVDLTGKTNVITVNANNKTGKVNGILAEDSATVKIVNGGSLDVDVIKNSTYNGINGDDVSGLANYGSTMEINTGDGYVDINVDLDSTNYQSGGSHGIFITTESGNSGNKIYNDAKTSIKGTYINVDASNDLGAVYGIMVNGDDNNSGKKAEFNLTATGYDSENIGIDISAINNGYSYNTAAGIQVNGNSEAIINSNSGDVYISGQSTNGLGYGVLAAGNPSGNSILKISGVNTHISGSYAAVSAGTSAENKSSIEITATKGDNIFEGTTFGILNQLSSTTDVKAEFGYNVIKNGNSGIYTLNNLQGKSNISLTALGNTIETSNYGIYSNNGIVTLTANGNNYENVLTKNSSSIWAYNTSKVNLIAEEGFNKLESSGTAIYSDDKDTMVNLTAKGNTISAGTGIWGLDNGKVSLDASTLTNEITADSYGIFADTKSDIDLNAGNSNNILSAKTTITDEETGETGDYGTAYAVNALSGSSVDLAAGEQNYLLGSVYANGTGTNVDVKGKDGSTATNVIRSYAVINNAGDLNTNEEFKDKSVVSALYAQNGANIELTGENYIGTYADNTDKDTLERTVWAYNEGTIDITGAAQIGTDRYDSSPNSADVAIAAGTATNLTKDIVDNYDETVNPRATVTVNYDDFKDENGVSISKSNISGDILSAYAGQVDIATDNSEAGINIYGNLLAGNNGILSVDLGKGGTLIGRADDYGDAGYVGNIENEGDSNEHQNFYNPEFSSTIYSGGRVDLEMGAGSTWYVTGQSWITSINTEKAQGDTQDTRATIDLTTLYENDEADATTAHALTVYDFKGDADFKMNLSGDRANSDMLYMKHADGTYRINLVDAVTTDEINSDQNGNEFSGLRFATVGSDSKVNFVVGSYDNGGAFNVEYEVGTDEYGGAETARENAVYNGSSLNSGKPGSDMVDGFFGSDGEPVSSDNNTESGISTMDLQAANNIMLMSEEAATLDETAAAANDAADYNATNHKIIARLGEEISDTGKTILNMSRANYSNAIYMDRLNKRLGEARYINSEEDEGMWVRIRHDRIGKDDAYRSQNTMYELGYDQKQECDNGERRVGMAIDYMHGDTGYDQIAGKGEIDRYGLWLYDTWMGDKGHYADYVAKWGHLSNDFEVYTMQNGDKVTGDYSNNVFSVSAEYGRKKDIGNDWYFEPQVQAQLARVTGADYTTNQGTKVSVDGINSLIGRAGFRLGKDFGEEKQSTVYIKADVLHEFLGDQDVRVLDKSSDNKWAGISYENEGTWYDVGFGFATQMSKNSYAFMDFEKSFGNDNDETYQINVGMQWSF